MLESSASFCGLGVWFFFCGAWFARAVPQGHPFFFCEGMLHLFAQRGGFYRALLSSLWKYV